MDRHKLSFRALSLRKSTNNDDCECDNWEIFISNLAHDKVLQRHWYTNTLQHETWSMRCLAFVSNESDYLVSFFVFWCCIFDTGYYIVSAKPNTLSPKPVGLVYTKRLSPIWIICTNIIRNSVSRSCPGANRENQKGNFTLMKLQLSVQF